MSNLHQSWSSLSLLIPFFTSYSHIGIFRNDVVFIDEVNIFERDFAIPRWGSFWGFNDRMFYGKKEVSVNCLLASTSFAGNMHSSIKEVDSSRERIVV